MVQKHTFPQGDENCSRQAQAPPAPIKNMLPRKGINTLPSTYVLLLKLLILSEHFLQEETTMTWKETGIASLRETKDH
jgi:hypothetical protein